MPALEGADIFPGEYFNGFPFAENIFVFGRFHQPALVGRVKVRKDRTATLVQDRVGVKKLGLAIISGDRFLQTRLDRLAYQRQDVEINPDGELILPVFFQEDGEEELNDAVGLLDPVFKRARKQRFGLAGEFFLLDEDAHQVVENLVILIVSRFQHRQEEVSFPAVQIFFPGQDGDQGRAEFGIFRILQKCR